MSGLLARPGLGQGVLVGCRLGATLQCVPGLTMKPEQQIKVLEQQIAKDQQTEGAIRQTIEGLRAPLEGEPAPPLSSGRPSEPSHPSPQRAVATG